MTVGSGSRDRAVEYGQGRQIQKNNILSRIASCIGSRQLPKYVINLQTEPRVQSVRGVRAATKYRRGAIRYALATRKSIPLTPEGSREMGPVADTLPPNGLSLLGLLAKIKV